MPDPMETGMLRHHSGTHCPGREGHWTPEPFSHPSLMQVEHPEGPSLFSSPISVLPCPLSATGHHLGQV